MYSAKCRCGQSILVRSVRLDVERIFFLAMERGALHGRTVCPHCGERLSLDRLEPQESRSGDVLRPSSPACAASRPRSGRTA